jgi:transposase
VSGVSEIAPQLPTDIEALQALIAAARAERDAAVVERDQALSQIDRLRHLLRQLQRAQFGRRSEKLDPEQLLLAIEDIEQAIAGNEAADESGGGTRARRQAARQSRRAPRPSAACRCDDRAGRYQLPVLPRANACHWRRDLAAARRDPGAVPGDRDAPPQIRLPGVRAGGGSGAGAGAADQGRTADRGDGRLRAGRAKYPWHLPLYRQAQMLLAQGLDIKRAILAFWVGNAATELQPLYARLRELILNAGKIAVDETVAPVLDPGRGRTKKGYFWTIARDDRPWGGTDPPAIAYTYAPGRGAVHALKLLDHYRGIVQCDGYAAYKTIANTARDEAITLAFCWAHLRRRFFDIAQGGPAPIASEALARIGALYAIEKTIRGRGAGERRAVRQAQAGQSLAGLAHRRTYGMGLGAGALRNPPSGVTRGDLPKAG